MAAASSSSSTTPLSPRSALSALQSIDAVALDAASLLGGLQSSLQALTLRVVAKMIEIESRNASLLGIRGWGAWYTDVDLEDALVPAIREIEREGVPPTDA